MGKFVIKGGKPLFGKVNVSGSKNGALPIIFATLATRGVSIIENVPDIGDVRAAISIIKCFGAECEFSPGRLRVDTRRVNYATPPEELISSIRASTYLLGATLAGFGRAEIRCYGGCNFSLRPIDMHIDAMRAFGGEIDGAKISAKKLTPAKIEFKKCSVGATVNSLILAASTEGESEICGIATEPHILCLVEYLRSAGAKIEIKDNTAYVGGTKLHGGKVKILGDMIEAGTYIVASLISGGAVSVSGVPRTELNSFLSPLTASGIQVFEDSRGILARGKPSGKMDILTAPYPGFPTDLQPIIAPLLSFSGGRIVDTVWGERLGYLRGLSDFGIAYRLTSGGAEIFPSEIKNANTRASDLRGGAALILAALAADGESVIENAEHILRGYENPKEKLSLLGAEIEYIVN